MRAMSDGRRGTTLWPPGTSAGREPARPTHTSGLPTKSPSGKPRSPWRPVAAPPRSRKKKTRVVAGPVRRCELARPPLPSPTDARQFKSGGQPLPGRSWIGASSAWLSSARQRPQASSREHEVRGLALRAALPGASRSARQLRVERSAARGPRDRGERRGALAADHVDEHLARRDHLRDRASTVIARGSWSGGPARRDC
jgi:hypothetical protein